MRLPAARRSRRPRRSGALPSSIAHCRISPSRVNSFSSACSRTLHVLITMTSASPSSGGRLVAGLLQQPGHPLGVVDVHLAAEGLDRSTSGHFVPFAFDLSLSPFIRLSPSRRSRRAASRARWPAPRRRRRCRRSCARSPLPARRRRAAPRAVSVRPWRTDFAMWNCVAAVRRDLRQVRDAQHLEPLGQPLQPAADDVGHRAADAGVHLVEDQRLARARRSTPASSARA